MPTCAKRSMICTPGRITTTVTASTRPLPKRALLWLVFVWVTKFNRFKTLSRATEKKVTDESIRDTLLDLANYALMTVLEMEIGHGE